METMQTREVTKEALINSRIDADLKQQGDLILAQIGLKPSQAITMLYKQIVRQKGIPFDLETPNEETIAAIQELKNPETRKNLKQFSSIDELMAD